MTPLIAPAYDDPRSPALRGRAKLGLAVEGMRRHMTDEGWQLFAGLRYAGYQLAGKDLPPLNTTDVPALLSQLQPSVVVVQDKREWMGMTADRRRDQSVVFRGVEALAEREDIFKVAVLKDAHQDNSFQLQSANEIGAHAWIVYYDPERVVRYAPFVRREHLIRTYHSIDADAVPEYDSRGRSGTLLSGAVSSAYPLRKRLFDEAACLPDCTVLRHPGYHRRGCATPDYLRALSRHKVAICTASIYGYALRKIIEATACGCVVVTDLQETDKLPEIDGNLVRVSPDTPTKAIANLIHSLVAGYQPDRQAAYAIKAKEFYDYRAAGERLAFDIESMRLAYYDAQTPQEAAR